MSVVPNNQPRLRIEGDLGRRGEGFHDLMNGVGAHEIVAETPRHDLSLHELEVEEIADVVRACVARIVDLERDARIRYVLIFKNIEDAMRHIIGVPHAKIKTKLDAEKEAKKLKRTRKSKLAAFRALNSRD